MKSALLVVDVQQFYLKDIPAELPQRIVRHYESVPYNGIVFSVFRNQASSNFNDSLKWDKCSEKEDGRLPAEFKKFVNNQNVFSRAAYSAFKTTGLQAYLDNLGIKRLVLCGVDSDACVLATAFEAFDLGYHVKVNFDLSYSSGDLQTAAEQIVARSISSRD